ncbi:MAG: hypothetical protein ACPGWR_32325 [Ardenticatenaceae bacterium]
MKEYKHTQIGYLLLILYSGVILLIAYLALMSGFNPIALVALLVMLVVLALFATLSVTVDQEMIKLQFGIGLIRKGFRVDQIEAYQVVKNPWYYGWGIRYTPRGWLFNVSGLSALELQMKNGKTYRIGTDDPQGFAQAVEQALNHF